MHSSGVAKEPEKDSEKDERIAQISAIAIRPADVETVKAFMEHEARAEVAHDRCMRSMRSVGAARLLTSSVDSPTCVRAAGV